MYLKEFQVIALEQLAKYKYLTATQLLRLGVYKNRGTLTNTLKEITQGNRPLLAKNVFGFFPGVGRVEDFYYLTKWGVRFLVEELNYSLDEIKAVHENSTLFQRDYFHRKFTIDFNIGFTTWLEEQNGEIELLNYYFDKKGNNRSPNKKEHLQALNKLILKNGTSLIPDLIAKFNYNGRDLLYLFEQHNGKSSKRLIEQLFVHLLAIQDGTAREKFDFEKSNRVVVVCEFLEVKNSVIKRLKENDNFLNFHKFFIFKTNEELKNGFFENWELISGEKVHFV